MKPSTIWADKLKKLTGVFFWLAIWQFAAMKIGKEVLLASPVSTIKALISLCGQSVFWSAIIFSLTRIMLGFALALVTGVLLAGLSAVYDAVRYIFAPLFNVIKAVPVASFIILALLWVRGGNLSICISFLMVLPIIYNNMLAGFTRVDKSLLEMAAVFRLSNMKKIKYIYIPQVLPYFTAACTTSLGLCWKSGIAAEVIGMPAGSMGNRLYETKLYMDTPEMFAWTVVIVIISFVVEKGFLWLLDKITARITDGFL
ncbi:MAG: ABC transporter permease subunit [Oscillospiraceae bacterium]|nr:ABC transporter permease subunit [Oscillospiraceae bacterium]